jgi:peroxiredoxin
MIATLFLFGCILATGQTADRSEWMLAPRLSRAQEFVYSGSFAEEATGGGVQFNRAYRVESRVLVLDTSSKGAEVALFTVLKLRESNGGKTGIKIDAAPSSVRLELVKLDPHGRLTAGPGLSLAVPLEGPPSLECGAFVEGPHRRIGIDQTWEVTEDGRPLHIWKIVGTELVGGVRCFKLVGTQQSDDWDQPRGDRTAWRRRDTVWVDTVVGVAQRLERVIERREPARQEPTLRSVLRYDLESNLQYPRALFEDRRNEIAQARAYAESLTPLLANPGKHAAQLDALLAKITYHVQHEPASPYREALLQVKRRAEAARRGETPPQLPSEAAAPVTVALPGHQAPDFLAPDFLNKEPARLRKWLGKPIVLIFYYPSSESARELLRWAQRLYETYRPGVAVIGLPLSDDADQVRRQHEALSLTFPMINGSGLKHTYAVDSTPKLVVIDSSGIVRAAFTGWGQETPDEVSEELKRWLPHDESPAKPRTK